MYKTERTSELKQGKGDRNRYPHGAPVLLGRAWDKGRGALSGVQCAAGIRPAAAGQMPARGQQALLLKLPHPLLQAGNAPTDARRDALCRAADATEPPHTGAAPYGGNHA